METVSPSQEMILDAAKHLIMRNGFDGFSMRQLSEESGFAKGTIYHYFRDKQELYLEVIEREMLDTERVLCKAATQGSSPPQQLRAMIEAYLHLAEEKHHSMFLLLREVGHLDEELRALLQRHRGPLLQPFRDVLERGVRQGTFRPVDADTTVSALLGMMNSMVTFRLFAQEEQSGQPLIDAVLDLFCNGVCTHSTRLRKRGCSS